MQEYIELYLETKDEAWFAAFMHYYEPALNDMASGFVQSYAMHGHFSDIKSACVFGLMTALQSYDKGKGPLIPYAKYEIKRAVHEYIRTMRTGFTVPEDKQDYLLRKAMRLFAEHDYKTDDATVEEIAAAIRRKPKTVRELLQAGMRNMQFTDFYRSYADEEAETSAENVTCDYSSEPGAMFFRDELAADLYEAFQNLEYRERDMLSLHLGFCPECFATRDKDGKPLEKWTYADLMLRYGLSSPDTVELACKKALEKMKIAVVVN